MTLFLINEYNITSIIEFLKAKGPNWTLNFRPTSTLDHHIFFCSQLELNVSILVKITPYRKWKAKLTLNSDELDLWAPHFTSDSSNISPTTSSPLFEKKVNFPCFQECIIQIFNKKKGGSNIYLPNFTHFTKFSHVFTFNY